MLFRYLAVTFAAGAVAMTAIAVLLSVRVGQARGPLWPHTTPVQQSRAAGAPAACLTQRHLCCCPARLAHGS